jgi:hypothetical protein
MCSDPPPPCPAASLELLPLLPAARADVICFQETKVRRQELEREAALAEGWWVAPSGGTPQKAPTTPHRTACRHAGTHSSATARTPRRATRAWPPLCAHKSARPCRQRTASLAHGAWTGVSPRLPARTSLGDPLLPLSPGQQAARGAPGSTPRPAAPHRAAQASGALRKVRRRGPCSRASPGSSWRRSTAKGAASSQTMARWSS